MYQIKVNEKLAFEVGDGPGGLTVKGNALQPDISNIAPGVYHIINGTGSYNVEVVNFDNTAKTAEIKVNGNTYQVSAKDQFDLLLDKLGMSSADSAKVADLKAPMPGLVLKIFVNEGDTIKKGDNLFTLEAMKMENIIKAPADVTVKSIKVTPGDKVEKGQLLMLFA
ncbi:acetyl-CoA carboxylase biotin carboxyl carrier protein subunit [Mucilaginibacter myungsuensis]|uniref:Biotin/lipoyl-binding protein n=1 Tax=Mucilaginibacter myungsuensis TaxID=649104 RepID=A0A929PWP3_9SPHI|nr:acetyl-CoA carboxylase biotin carboxyl carrier protein subunit [Mucilaginibacter myungsuensis]MBE9662301.1 biotin/lipoyl-binding protein [Mucilaginibacter myungsuensis]MDN3599262.1 acetyl-CoA carboxylase biotin carboxyl carrier protein subunit [Mucilaginibacter myungsuensis]